VVEQVTTSELAGRPLAMKIIEYSMALLNLVYRRVKITVPKRRHLQSPFEMGDSERPPIGFIFRDKGTGPSSYHHQKAANSDIHL